MNSQAEESNQEAKTHTLVRYDAMCRAIDQAAMFAGCCARGSQC